MVKQKTTYRLLCRFESLVAQINNLKTTTSKLRNVRYKPLYTSYNSCIEELKTHYSAQYKQLNLELLPLYDANGIELFTNEKISTLLHQSEAIVAILRGSLPPNYSGGPETFRESLGWYWDNTHRSVAIFFIGLLFSALIAGIMLSETSLYKNTIRPFIQEYMSR